MIRSCSLKPQQIYKPAGEKQKISSQFFSSFQVGGTCITKHLMTGPTRNSEFCFPSTSMFPSASPQETLGVWGETKLTVSFGASHQVLIGDWHLTIWVEVIFRVKWIVFICWWCHKFGLLKVIGQFSFHGIGGRTCIKFVVSHSSVSIHLLLVKLASFRSVYC